jgi:hypothetical protein
MSKITVGQSKVIDRNSGCERSYRYSDVPTGLENTPDQGWVIDTNYLPIPYDLVHLKLDSISKPKSGWWTGKSWKGLRVQGTDKVIKWKRNHDHD